MNTCSTSDLVHAIGDVTHSVAAEPVSSTITPSRDGWHGLGDNPSGEGATARHIGGPVGAPARSAVCALVCVFWYVYDVDQYLDVYSGATLLIAATNSRGTGHAMQVWQKRTTHFTATATRTTLNFYNGDPTSDTNWGLDGVSVVPTP